MGMLWGCCGIASRFKEKNAEGLVIGCLRQRVNIGLWTVSTNCCRKSPCNDAPLESILVEVCLAHEGWELKVGAGCNRVYALME